MTYIKTISILITVCFSLSVWSKPSEDIPNYLLTSPVTLMDFGLSSLSQNLSFIKQMKGSESIIVSPIFRKETNVFELKINSLGPPDKTLKVASSNCKNSITNVREFLGVNSKSGKPYSGHSSNFGAFFESYLTTKRPKDMRVKLDKMVVIVAYFSIEEKDTFIRCSGNLLDSVIDIEEPQKHKT